MLLRVKFIFNIGLVLLLFGCANVVMPTGGEKDITPPEIQNISFLHSQKNMNTNIIQFDFDEYIKINNWEENFFISPPVTNRIQKKIKGKSLFLTIEGPLAKAVSYNVCLNSCIKDNNEGNILENLSYIFSLTQRVDTFTLTGLLQDAYTLDSLSNACVMLFDSSLDDSLIFEDPPNYLSKTNQYGGFYFPNLDSGSYKIAAISDFDFNYNTGAKIAFFDSVINAKYDTVISLFAFDPLQKDSIITDSLLFFKNDSISHDSLNSIILEEEYLTGKLEIIVNKIHPCIFQLIKDDQVIMETSFIEAPYIIDKINPGKYKLKYIFDTNQDGRWNTGIWESRIQPEKVVFYPGEIIIRSNWDLVLEWTISE